MSEEWRDVAGHRGRYRVSSTGLVESLGRYVDNRGTPQWRPGRILKPLRRNRRYRAVCLRDGYSSEQPLISTLVLEAFVGPRPSKAYEARHLDGNRSNNTLSNLSWQLRVTNKGRPQTRDSRGIYRAQLSRSGAVDRVQSSVTAPTSGTVTPGAPTKNQ